MPKKRDGDGTLEARDDSPFWERDPVAFLELITDSIPAFVSYVDRDLRYRFTNRAYSELFDREGFAGLHVEEVIGPNALADVRPHLDRALAGETVKYRQRMTYANGKTLHAEAVMTPHRDPEGEVQGLVVVVRDISALVAGVGHEINNPLMFTSANLDYLSEQLAELREQLLGVDDLHLPSTFDELLEVIAEAKEGTRRVAAVVSDLQRLAGEDRATPIEADPSAAEARLRVLVVDDEEAVCNSLIRLLRRAHDVTAVMNGPAALERVEAGQYYDVILCDLMMPKMSGMQLYEQLAQRSASAARRMVFLSGGTFTPEARRFVRAVSNPFLTKPITAVALRAAVARHAAACAASSDG